MDLFIAIDSGGTKTDALLADSAGNVLRRAFGRGCNPMDVGVPMTQATICDVIARLMEDAPGTVVSLYAGIAGANRTETGLQALIPERYGIPNVRVEDDMRIVVSGTLGHRNGCGLICGTGCSLSLVSEKWPFSQIGGLGYLIDTGGSGYELGQAALKHAFRYLDGRGPYTVLAELLPQKMGKGLQEGFADIYAGGRACIASLAGTVFAGMAQGDAICRQIAEEGSTALAELTWAAERHFDGAFPVVMTGGIFSAFPEYAEMVCQKASKNAKMTKASAPPVYGSQVEAYYQQGIPVSDRIRDNFSKTCHTAPVI